jgi:hypothetical protein
MATRAGIALQLPGWAGISSPAGPAPARPSWLLRPACPGWAAVPFPPGPTPVSRLGRRPSTPGWAGALASRVGRCLAPIPAWAAIPPGLPASPLLGLRAPPPGQASAPRVGRCLPAPGWAGIAAPAGPASSGKRAFGLDPLVPASIWAGTKGPATSPQNGLAAYEALVPARNEPLVPV